jgi:hypothetical protein
MNCEVVGMCVVAVPVLAAKIMRVRGMQWLSCATFSMLLVQSNGTT